MKKVIVFLLTSNLIGCNTSGIDLKNACAEINSTRVFESSKRMEILKSYGLTPVQAETVENIMGYQRKVLMFTCTA